MGTPFHILSIEGLPKTGKTHFACTAPGAVAFQSLDFGTEGIIEKHERKFEVREYNFSYDLTIKARGSEAEEQAEAIRYQYWKPFNDDCAEFFGNPEFKTVVWDTASEVWEMLRLSNFGKLVQNPQLAYGPVNAEYKALVRMANVARKNLVLIHQMTKEFKNNEETGNWKRVGNNKVDYLVHTYVRTHYQDPVKDVKGNVKTPGGFKLEILRSRYNPDVNGMVLDSPDWVTLMGLVAPHIDAEAWDV